MNSSPLALCFFCNDLTAAGEISWVEDYIISIGYPLLWAPVFPSIMLFSCWCFSAPWLETTLLVRMCFTCAGPAEVIKGSAALWRKRMSLETRSFGKLVLAKAILVYRSCTISSDKLCMSWFRWTRHYCNFSPDFSVKKWHPW